MTKTQAFTLWAALAAGNFIFTAFADQNWMVPAQSTFAQAVALGLAAWRFPPRKDAM